MKTSEEMARSVIERARAHRTAQTRRTITAAAALLCVIAIGITAATQQKSSAPETDMLQVQPTTDALQIRPTVDTTPINTTPITVPIATQKGTLLRCLSAGAESVAMGEGVKIPYRMELRVADVRGMTADEANAVRAAEWKYAKSVIEQHKGEIGSGDWSFIQGGNNIIWCLHTEKINDLGLDPTIPLSIFGDTITVTITFKDGIVETHVIDIEIDDSGAVYAIYRGNTATV